MTARTREKTAARSLAALTGAPYQSCLTAVAVLDAVPAGFDLGGLHTLLGGGRRPVLLQVNLGKRDLADIARAAGPAEELWGTGDAVIRPAPYEGVRFFLPLPGSGAGSAGEASLYVDLILDTPRVRSGQWVVEAGALRRAVLAARHEGRQDCTVELSGRDGSSFGVLPEDVRDTYLSDTLRTAAPYRTSPGPGFEWMHLRFVDLDLVDDRDHHSADNCDNEGRCGLLHDWPTADPNRHELVVPEPLLTAWRRLAAADPEPISNESCSYRQEGRDGQPSWYGLDLPDFSAVWMRVETAYTAA